MLRGIKSAMNIIENVELKPLNHSSIYLKPFAVSYTQNGRPRTRDCFKQHDAVAVIIYNTTRDVLVFVRQFRPPVYISDVPPEERTRVDTAKHPGALGLTLEVCAGIVDKDLSLEQIAREEVLEECGYDVPLANLVEVAHVNGSPNMTTYYCEVTDEMRVEAGGGVDEEMIDIVEMTVDEAREYVEQEHVRSPPSFMFCVYWFLCNKAK